MFIEFTVMEKRLLEVLLLGELKRVVDQVIFENDPEECKAFEFRIQAANSLLDKMRSIPIIE